MSLASVAQALPPAMEFISGELTRLRPVLEADLPALAPLLAEAPLGFSFEREPWTLQRLTKRFEDEKSPGLWSARKRYYMVTDTAGTPVGALFEEVGRLGGSEILFHVALARPDRDALGPDMLRAFLAYKCSWQNCPRLESAVLEPQAAERAWLAACGFEHEIHCAEAWLHQGRYVGLEIYAWLAQWVQANRAAGGIGQ
jgi:RimJ/RimL family protein N-acetyltransferase